MKYVAEKVRDGVLDLDRIDTDTLIEWAVECEDHDDLDTLGHEIIYRQGEFKNDDMG